MNKIIQLVFAVFFCSFSTGIVVAQQSPNTLDDEELAEGWILLFDGETTFGWQSRGAANWTVKDGVLTASAGDRSLLCTTSRFKDFELLVDFRTTLGANSAVCLRVPADVEMGKLAQQCYAVMIAGEEQPTWPTGSLSERQRSPQKIPQNEENEVIRKRIDIVQERYSPEFSPRDNRWHTFHIRVEGGHIIVKLDGRKTVDYSDTQPLKPGVIGLQYQTGKVEFRNIKLKPLGMKSIFNGKDLTGWVEYPGMPAKFSVTPEGFLQVKNGKGQLETTGRYADFTLQMEIFVNGRGLNSGIFFRCIPGQFWMGYESQIQNSFKNNDRTKPLDCGTGGIFRRQPARKVVADDFVWFYKTIHVDGPHMAVWVNGYQVSDWTDTRAQHDNPRKGLRLEAGTIAIQAHDPTTDLKFRNIRIAE